MGAIPAKEYPSEAQRWACLQELLKSAACCQAQRMQSSLHTSGLLKRPHKLPVTQIIASLQSPQQASSRRHQQPALRPLTSSAVCQAATMEAPPKPPAVDLPREGPKYEYNGLDIGQDIDVAYGSDTQGIPKNRRSGVILHPTSLPGPYGTGEIGKEAYRFVDWLASAGMQIWQVPILTPGISFLGVTLIHRQGEGSRPAEASAEADGVSLAHRSPCSTHSYSLSAAVREAGCIKIYRRRVRFCLSLPLCARHHG